MSRHVIVTGPPRSGTTMLILMMHSVNDCSVYSDHERHPLHPNKFTGIKNKYIVYKHPYGYFEDFPPKYDYQELIDKGFKIISLIRNARDVLVSRHSLDPSKYWVPVKIWKRAAEQVIKHKNSKEVCIIRYEDLVTDPQYVMDKISKFLGCTCDKTFNDFYNSDSAKLDKNKSLGKLRPIDTKSINKWSKVKNVDYLNRILNFDPEIDQLDNELNYTYREDRVIWKPKNSS